MYKSISSSALVRAFVGVSYYHTDASTELRQMSIISNNLNQNLKKYLKLKSIFLHFCSKMHSPTTLLLTEEQKKSLIYKDFHLEKLGSDTTICITKL